MFLLLSDNDTRLLLEIQEKGLLEVIYSIHIMKYVYHRHTGEVIYKTQFSCNKNLVSLILFAWRAPTKRAF